MLEDGFELALDSLAVIHNVILSSPCILMRSVYGDLRSVVGLSVCVQGASGPFSDSLSMPLILFSSSEPPTSTGTRRAIARPGAAPAALRPDAWRQLCPGAVGAERAGGHAGARRQLRRTADGELRGPGTASPTEPDPAHARPGRGGAIPGADYLLFSR